MLTSSGRKDARAFGDIKDDIQRDAIVEWLNDRRDFHKWFASLTTLCFAAYSLFGTSFTELEITQRVFMTLALVCLLFSVLTNLVILWSIPSWKIRIQIKELNNASSMRWDFRITTWVGVVCFLTGLTLGFISNYPG